MQAPKAPETLTRQECVSYAVRQCALILDPRHCRLSSLAKEFDWHESTITVWMRQGRIPKKACRALLKRFGKKLIDVELLSQG